VSTGHHLVEDRPEAEDVAAMVDGLAAQLFRRHVGNRADHGSMLRDRGEVFDRAIVFRRSLEFGDSEIENLDASVISQKQIFRLEIAVHDKALVRGGQALHDLQGVISCLLRKNGARVQALAKVLTFKQFRNDVGNGAFKADIVDGENVGMVQSGGGARLLFEAAQMVGVGAGGGPDQLQGDVAAQPLVACAKYFTHPSRTNFFEDPVVPDKLASHKEYIKSALCLAC